MNTKYNYFIFYLFSEGCKTGGDFLIAYIVQTFSEESDAFMYSKNAQSINAEVPQFSYNKIILVKT